ncbi:MAG: glycosyl transferase, partial [Microbacterium sp.]
GDGDARSPEAGTTRRVSRPVRRLALAIPALAVTAALATGCTSESWPDFSAATATPSPTPSVTAPENQKPPAVTEAQATRILQKISSTLEQADSGRDIDLAATRIEGSVLDGRRTAYALGAKIADYAAPAAIPTDKIEVLLPEATERWPRTVLMLTKSSGDDKVPPAIFTMSQADPWSDYRVTSMAEMQASAELPKLAPRWLGTTLVPPDSTFLSVAPDEIATAFSSLVDDGDKSEYSATFDDLTHQFAESVLASRQAVVQGLADKGAAETSKVAFDMTPSDAEPISLATFDSGAVVSVSVIDVQTVTPTSSDAVIKFDNNPEAKALTGVAEASKGVKTTYGIQLFFAVPTQGSSEQVRLLGAHQDLLNIEVIK